ncbi:DEKNAAC104296 [Brettanomyces naardenensis]|uniref:protein-serine/threonine phosphatase n=1 Tax=Brettanomyces naardenensis TaxID=13370 RepID=A0A448YQF4_BRENA|nr:DEKNAAC104296 [Brettanomyces naardenensis]
MGQILSQPITEKSSEEGGDKFVAYGLSCMQGWRISMEDSHSTVLDLKSVEVVNGKGGKGESSDSSDSQIAYFGVFDGHGGEKVAQFTGKNLPRILKQTDAFGENDFIKVFKDGYLAADVAILKDDELSKDPSGCAATSVLITDKLIVCGNAGDSRTVMSVGGQCKPLSFDHKPTNEGEKARIVAAGGYVDLGRVNGNLALSRGIGDFEFKNATDLPAEEQAVTALPDVIVHDATKEDEFIILACDGIWDCLTSQQAVDFVRRGIKLKQSMTEICENMMDTCLAPTSGGSGIGCDNMSVCIVALLRGQTLEDWYDKIGSKITEDDLAKLPTPNELSLDLYKVDLESKQQQNAKNEEAAKGSSSGAADYDDEEDNPILKAGATGGAPNLIQQLLAASNISTNNDIIYLDSSASSILQSLGVMEEDEDDNGGDKKMEEIEEEEEEKTETESDKAEEEPKSDKQ